MVIMAPCIVLLASFSIKQNAHTSTVGHKHTHARTRLLLEGVIRRIEIEAASCLYCILFVRGKMSNRAQIKSRGKKVRGTVAAAAQK